MVDRPVIPDAFEKRLKRAGIAMTVTNTMVAELVQDWSTPQGQQLVRLLFAAAPMQPIE